MLLYKELSNGKPNCRVVWAWLRRCVGGEWVCCEWVRREYNGNEAGVYSYTRLDQDSYEAVTGHARPELPEWQSDEKWHGLKHPADIEPGMPGGPLSDGARRVIERGPPKGYQWIDSAPEFTFPNRPIVPTQPAAFDVDIMGEPDPDRVDRPMTPMAEAMVVDLNAKYCHEHRQFNATSSIDCVRRNARYPANDPLRYTCRCHEILGNDFWFLPKGQCIMLATAPHRPIGAKRGDKWTEVAAERDRGKGYDVC